MTVSHQNLRVIFGTGTLGMAVAHQLENPFVVDSSKFVKAFGDIATPHRDAIRNTISW